MSSPKRLGEILEELGVSPGDLEASVAEARGVVRKVARYAGLGRAGLANLANRAKTPKRKQVAQIGELVAGIVEDGANQLLGKKVGR